MQNALLILLSVTAAALILNLPFGYLRASSKRFSFKWLLYIHLPVPFIFVLRNMAGLTYKIIPVIVVGAVVGQILGGRFNPERIS